jgi:hypothetical protein
MLAVSASYITMGTLSTVRSWSSHYHNISKLFCPWAIIRTSRENRLHNRGIFPSAWKKAIVTPVYKKGNKFNMNNYRPISILPVVSRVFERLLSVQLSNYIESNQLFSPYQHGFRTARSCQSALISLKNRLFKNRASKTVSAIASLDFSKAFDCIIMTSCFRNWTSLGCLRTACPGSNRIYTAELNV